VDGYLPEISSAQAAGRPASGILTKLRHAALALLAALPVVCSGAEAVKLEDLSVMALGALDGRAVVKSPGGKLQVLKVGDTIPGTHAVVTQVLADKLIVEDAAIGADKSARKQTVWISKAAKPGEKSSVQRIDVEPPPGKVIESKVMQSAPLPTQNKKK
jgi:hypothetical protein